MDSLMKHHHQSDLFAVLDLMGAYIPMGWLGGQLAHR